MPSLLWPWAIAVPLGFALALRASSKPGWILKLSGKHRDRLRQGLEGIGVLHSLLRHPYRYRGAWLGTALYWAADITAFYAALRLFGLNAEFGKVIIAYGTGYAATRRSLPLGGAGVTEALMTYALYWVREPLAPALAAVLAYRAFNFLLVAAPAMVAQRQLEPVLARSGSTRRAQLRRARRENPSG
jgi:uncharacterized membrane protein YbhN (UPF0104 family)